MTRLAMVLAGVCICVSVLAGQQPRDPRQPPRSPQPSAQAQPPQGDAQGFAAITGVVLSDGYPPKPLRRARVALNSSELSVGRTVITHDDGSFAFERLVPGSYALSAAKEAFVSLNYGAKRPVRPGVPVTVRRGERRHLTFTLPRGGVITGTVTRPDGEPAAGMTVSAEVYRYVAGDRLPVTAGGTTVISDDRGVYRIFGLAAGDYIVSARVRAEQPDDGDVQAISEAEIRRALQEVRDPMNRPQGRPPAGAIVLPRATPERQAPPRLAPVHYPGTAALGDAAFVTVGRSEERAGIDFQIRYAPTATLSGMLLIPAGVQPPAVLLTAVGEGPAAAVVRSTLPGPDGQFTLTGVPPGHYALSARLILPGAQPIGSLPGRSAAVHWAYTEVFVDGQDVFGSVLTLNPALTISGHVEFEGESPRPSLDGVRVPLPALMRGGGVSLPRPAVRLAPDGRFTISGIIPGPYRLSTFVEGQRAPAGPWWLKSVKVGGRELLDAPLDLRQSADDAEVTFSDRATELRGTVKNSRGEPDSSRFVIVFGADRGAWFFNSRRVAGVQPDGAGRYSVRNLPPGEYFVSVLDDVEPGEWFDPTVLQRLVNDASRITLAQSERRTHDIATVSR